jgi:hypothetical protein
MKKVMMVMAIFAALSFLISIFAVSPSSAKQATQTAPTSKQQTQQGQATPALPDLIPQSIAVSPATPWAGDHVGPFTVKIKNQGGLSVGPSKAVFSCFGTICGPMTCPQCQGLKTRGYDPGLASAMEWNIPALNGGQSMSFTFTLSQPKSWPAGETALILFVNVDNLAQESNDNNNSKSVEITVNKKKKSEPTDKGPAHKVPMQRKN